MIVLRLIEKLVTYFSSIAILLMGLGALALLGVIWSEEGAMGVWNTLSKDVVSVTIKFIPVILVFFTITGALNHLQKNHKERFNNIITGKEGTFKMIALASCLPGPAGGKQLQDAWNTPQADRTKILMCLVGMMALGINVELMVI